MLISGSKYQTHCFAPKNCPLALDRKLLDKIRSIWIIAATSAEHGLSWVKKNPSVNSKKFCDSLPVLKKLRPKMKFVVHHDRASYALSKETRNICDKLKIEHIIGGVANRRQISIIQNIFAMVRKEYNRRRLELFASGQQFNNKKLVKASQLRTWCFTQQLGIQVHAYSTLDF